jgi:isocitrate dehydrogenase (NAD+)
MSALSTMFRSAAIRMPWRSQPASTPERKPAIIKFAFEYALRNGRKKVTVVHNAKVLKALTGLFLETGREVAAKYQGRTEANDRILVACAMHLVLDPWQFDVIVATNLFGDILSDEIAGLVGGLGLAPGANIRESAAMFEAVHGSAPDIAGMGIASPTALLLAAGLMLEHVERREQAQRLGAGIDLAMNRDNVRTRDLGGSTPTREFANAVARRV